MFFLCAPRSRYGEDAFSPQLIFPLHAPNSVFRADCVADGESSGGHRRLSVYDDCVRRDAKRGGKSSPQMEEQRPGVIALPV